MINKPLFPKEIDTSKIVIDSIKKKIFKNSKESKSCRVTYDFGNKNYGEFHIRVPKAHAPYGLSTMEEKDKDGNTDPSKPVKYSISVNVDGTPEIEEFKKKLFELDDRVIDHILKNANEDSKEWWGKPGGKDWTREQVSMTYNSLIKESKQESYSGTFKFKLPIFEQKPTFKVFDHNNKEINLIKTNEKGVSSIDWSWAKRNMTVEAIITCDSLWIVDKKVYCSFKAQQLKVYPPTGLRDNEFSEEVPEVNAISNIMEQAKIVDKEESEPEDGPDDFENEDEDEDED